MHTLEDAVAQLFAAHGYEVSRQAVLEGRSGSVHTVPVLAEDAQAILVFIDLEQEMTTGELAALRADLGADLLVAVGHPHGTDGIVAWDRPTLERVLGQMVLLQAGVRVDPLPLATTVPHTVDEMLPPSFQPATAEAPDALETPMGFDLDGLQAAADAFAMPEPEPPVPTTPAPPAPVHPSHDPDAGWQTPRPPAPSEDDPFGIPQAPRFLPPSDAEPLTRPEGEWPANPADPQWNLDAHPETIEPVRLPVRLTPRQAFDYAKQHMGTVDRYELILQPVHLYDAEVDTFVQGSLDARTKDLRLEVNGTDRAVQQVDPKLVDPSAPDLLPAHHDIALDVRTLRIQPERALAEVHAFIKQEFARVIEVPSGDDDLYSMTERRRIEPNDDEIRVRPIGVYHRPVWRLLGVHGTVEVDAMTGETRPVNVRSFPDAIILD